MQTGTFPKTERDATKQSWRSMWAGLGTLGLVLAIYSVNAWISSGEEDRLGSISATYYTQSRDAFVGCLCVIGFSFLYYTGFPNEPLRRKSGRLIDKLSDKWVGTVAGIGAITTAVVPHEVAQKDVSPCGSTFECTRPDWTFVPDVIFGIPAFWFHYIGATLLFGCMAIFCIFLFTRGNGTEKNWEFSERQNKHGIPQIEWSHQNLIYTGIGLMICLCMVAIGIILASGNDRSIFWPELAAVLLFTVAWLMKWGDKGTSHPR